MSKRDMTSGWRAWVSMWETQMAAATTIAARMPILFAAGAGSPKAMRETRRMCSEKYAAAVEGTIAAGQEWGKLWMRMPMGQDPGGDLSSIVHAAIKPAQRTCKANALRLGAHRKKPRRRG
jgi:hypothetical protein